MAAKDNTVFSVILQFCGNLNVLIEMTEQLAEPKELPFLAMIVNILPEMLCIPETLLK